jgi:hypothetical protein
MAKAQSKKTTPKKAAPRVRYSLGGKVGGEVQETSVAPTASEQLSEVQKYYIAGHPQKSDQELALELGVQAKLIELYRFEVTHSSPVNRMLHRPAKGVVAMTEASSMAREERGRGQVTNLEIRKAIADGDLEKAAKLQRELKEQTAATEQAKREQYSDRIHYIR